MGGRRPDIAKHARLFDTIEKYPGLTIWQISKILGVSQSTVRSLLPSMENTGYLLTEDADGRLYTFYHNDIIGQKRRWAVLLYRSGFPLPQIAQMVFGYRAGDSHQRIKDWVKRASS